MRRSNNGFTTYNSEVGNLCNVPCTHGVHDVALYHYGGKGPMRFGTVLSTHLGFVFDGELCCRGSHRERTLFEGDFFSVTGTCELSGLGSAFICSAMGYVGMDMLGGPIEAVGKLKYIDGCTDSLLVPPVRRGNPCLNHLHFPPRVVQTIHTHPSLRAGLVYRGEGVCVLPDANLKVPLRPGTMFLLEPDIKHAFNTQEHVLDIIAFHPDSDTGVTDDDHPMVNRTIVDGVSANQLGHIRTK